jgi:hypothetical protein
LRRATALLGIFAVLFQATLWGWHHHTYLPFSRGGPGLQVVAASAGNQTPAADDECQICFALGHHGAAPVDLFTATPPDYLPAEPPRAAAVASPLASYFLFRSRAPPRA